MKKPATNSARLAALLLPILLLAACASPAPKGPAKVIVVQETKSLDLSDGQGSITIRVHDGDTVVTIDDRTFICRAVEGYIGRLDTHHGWLKIGKLEISYDPEKVWIRGPKTWTTFAREGDQNYIVAQDGSLGRSIFKG